MAYTQAWAAISARLDGLHRAGELHALFLSGNASNDHFGTGRKLRASCEDLIKEIRSFAETFDSALPERARECIDRHLSGNHIAAALLEQNAHRAATSALVGLAAFKSELDFVLFDQRERVKRRSELAFLHLQRLLAVDDEVQAKWLRAWDASGSRETGCEKLGAAHLLAHGIYAFKAHAEKGRTDLVFDEALNIDDLSRAVEGAVLTEWKVGEEKDAEDLFKKAQHQARDYQEGVLGGLELTKYRYLILVTRKSRRRYPDVVADGTTYRRISIALEPDTPRQAADSAIAAEKKAVREAVAGDAGEVHSA